MINNFGYMRVAAASPEVKPGDIRFNIENICNTVGRAAEKETQIIVFPELCVTGYTCGDLFYQSLLLDSVDDALKEIAVKTAEYDMMIVVGTPLVYGGAIYNCAVVIAKGKIIGAVPKHYLPNYNEFYEHRWFSDASKALAREGYCKSDKSIPLLTNTLFRYADALVGIEICEDLWVPAPPSSNMAVAGAQVILNLSATNEVAGKHDYLLGLIANQSARCRCAYIYASAGLGESSTDLVFSGNCIIAEDGNILGESTRFELNSKLLIKDIDIEEINNDRRKFSTFSEVPTLSFDIIDIPSDPSDSPDFEKELLRNISSSPFISNDRDTLRKRCEEISEMQVWGLAQRLRAINCKKAVIGISGGLDSTLALLVTVHAFDKLGIDRKGIIGVTMPGFGTTRRTRSNATDLMDCLGVTNICIPINDSVKQHFKDIDHDPEIHDATYENSQARERTQILMDLANQTGGIVIGTGDLSELALGWCTYNGDQMSMYGVNSSIPKTLVIHLVNWYAERTDNPEEKRILLDIIDTPISPELLPSAADGTIEQKTEDLVGPYELHDFFLHAMLRDNFSPRKIYFLACRAFEGKYTAETIKHWLKTFYRRFFSQQFKRSCMPDGIKVGSVTLSPRGDWRMPSDASSRLWLDEVERL